MRKEDKEIIKLTAKELLLTLCDASAGLILAMDRYRQYRVPIKKYFRERSIDRENFRQKIYYLKRMGLIRTFVEGKEKYLELTKKGLQEIAWDNIGKQSREGKWDGLFRIVMFDIPEEKRHTRDIIRQKLEEIGFIQVQKSIFIYPFECKEEIDAICYFCSAKEYLKYMIANVIEGEDDIIRIFFDKKVLTGSDLKT